MNIKSIFKTQLYRFDTQPFTNIQYATTYNQVWSKGYLLFSVEAELLQDLNLHREVINLPSEVINLPSEVFNLCLYKKEQSYSVSQCIKN